MAARLPPPAAPAPACISLVGVGKQYGKTRVLEGIDLELPANELCVFVGPSGCGKSTLLRMIAGLEDITSGDLFIDGKRANDLPPSRRGVAMVFQSYALYPHMTVYGNIAFGLGLATREADRRIRDAAQLLQIEPLLDRLPRELSGGQRQRVAIGRAITRQAKIFLLDEPLSNLDAALRVAMRSELVRLRRQLQTTMIYVTHDQVEAMTMADRLVVLHAGRIEQVGPPLEVYHRPATLFAAGFLGSPRMNFLRGEIEAIGSSGVALRLAGGETVVAPVSGSGVTRGQTVTLGIRPEHVRVGAAGGTRQALVQLVEDLGDHAILYLESAAAEGRLVARVHAAPAREGGRVTVELPPEDCHVFADSGRALPRLDR